MKRSNASFGSLLIAAFLHAVSLFCEVVERRWYPAPPCHRCSSCVLQVVQLADWRRSGHALQRRPGVPFRVAAVRGVVSASASSERSGERPRHHQYGPRGHGARLRHRLPPLLVYAASTLRLWWQVRPYLHLKGSDGKELSERFDTQVRYSKDSIFNF